MKSRETLFLLILLIAVASFYQKTRNYPLLWDDRLQLEQNPILTAQAPLSKALFMGYWEPLGMVKPGEDYYRPLLTLSWMGEARLWGLHPARLREVNILLFCGILPLLYLFFRREGMGQSLAGALTALFAFFPLQGDNIVWIVGRADLLLLLFGFLALTTLQRSLKGNRPLWAALSSLAFLGGIFSKEAFLFWLPLLFLYDLFKRDRHPLWPLHWANLFWTALFFLFRKGMTGGVGPSLFFPAHPLEGALKALGYYSGWLLFPYGRGMFEPLDRLSLPLTLLFALLLLSLSLLWLLKTLGPGRLSWEKVREALPLLFLLLPLGGYLLLSFTPIYPFGLSTRYLALPFFGCLWMGGTVLKEFKPLPMRVLTVLLLLSYLPVLFLRILDYRSDVSFWMVHYGKAPGNSFLAYQAGRAHYEAGRYREADSLLDKALRGNFQRETATAIGLLKGEIRFKKADYSGVQEWIGALGGLSLTPRARESRNLLLLRLLLAQGQGERAEECWRSLKGGVEGWKRVARFWSHRGEWERAKRAASAGGFSGPWEEERRRLEALDPWRLSQEAFGLGDFCGAADLLGKTSTPLQEALRGESLIRCGRRQEGIVLLESLAKREGGRYKPLVEGVLKEKLLL